MAALKLNINSLLVILNIIHLIAALRPEIPSSSNRLSATHHILDSNQDDATSSYATVSNFDHTYNRVCYVILFHIYCLL